MGDWGGAWVWEAAQVALQSGEVKYIILIMTTTSAKRGSSEVTLGTLTLAQHHYRLHRRVGFSV